MLKGSGGAIGLIGNPLRRWMVAGPYIASVTSELEEQAIHQQDIDTVHHHHDQQPGVQS